MDQFYGGRERKSKGSREMNTNLFNAGKTKGVLVISRRWHISRHHGMRSLMMMGIYKLSARRDQIDSRSMRF